MRRASGICASLALIAAIALPASGASQGTTRWSYNVLISGSIVTTWNVPHAAQWESDLADENGAPCLRKWVSGEGTQRVSFVTTRLVRAVGTTSPVPRLRLNFLRLPWRDSRQGTITFELQPLGPCWRGDGSKETFGGTGGDCGNRRITGYLHGGAAEGGRHVGIFGGPYSGEDFRTMYKNCPLLPGIVRVPGDSIQYFVERPNHIDESVGQGVLPGGKATLAPARAFRNCSTKVLTARHRSSQRRDGIVDPTGQRVPAAGLATWSSTTVFEWEVTFRRVGPCP